MHEAAPTLNCPRCDAQLPVDATVCDRCGCLFDPWGRGPAPAATQPLLDALEGEGDLPAVAQHVLEINRMATREDTSASQLANVVVRDYGLTTKLLRLVNSAFYRPVHGPVATVSRAVVLLGFEQVRRAAVSLVLFDRVRGRDPGGRRGAAALRAFAAGLMAQATYDAHRHGDAGEGPGGEAMLCGMFHSLGEQLLYAFFRDEADLIDARMQAGEPREVADRTILGLTRHDFGAAVALRWGFPDPLVLSAHALPDGPVPQPHNEVARLHVTAAFAHDLAVEGTSEAPDLDGLTARYNAALGVTAGRMRLLLQSVARALQGQADVLGLRAGDQELLRRLGGWADAAPEAVEAALDSARDEQRRRVLQAGVDEVAAAVAQRDDVNVVLSMVTETLYRGFGFDRVLLCIRDIDRRVLRPRHGFGRDLERLLAELDIPLAGGRDVFSHALAHGEDVVIDDIDADAVAPRIPGWYRRELGAPGFVAYPLRIQGVPVGLLYADSTQPVACFRRNRLLAMRTLRDHAAIALERARRPR